MHSTSGPKAVDVPQVCWHFVNMPPPVRHASKQVHFMSASHAVSSEQHICFVQAVHVVSPDMGAHGAPELEDDALAEVLDVVDALELAEVPVAAELDADAEEALVVDDAVPDALLCDDETALDEEAAVVLVPAVVELGPTEAVVEERSPP